MRRIIHDEHIKTIVALAHPPTHPLVAEEKALSRELGCTWVHVPIVDDRADTDGSFLFDRIEEAAAIIADPKNQPVYFHCHHGINRASMVQMAYRMLYCDWTLDQATDEIARTFGLTEVNHGPDYRHMAEFYRTRVLPLRAQKSKPHSSSLATCPQPPISQEITPLPRITHLHTPFPSTFFPPYGEVEAGRLPPASGPALDVSPGAWGPSSAPSTSVLQAGHHPPSSLPESLAAPRSSPTS